MTQKDKVLQIVKENSPLRTEQVKILAMKQGVSCGDRFLRWLSEEGLIDSYKKEGDRTKTWFIKEKQPVCEPVYPEGKDGQLAMMI